MDARDITLVVNDTVKNLRDGNSHIIDTAASTVVLESTPNNEEANAAFDMFHRLMTHEVVSAQHSHIKKEFDRSKKGLDEALSAMGVDPEPVQGTTKELYHANGIKFSKKHNKNGTQINVTDLLTQLARLGVEKAVVDKAVENATKEKRGNIYYVIEVD